MRVRTVLLAVVLPCVAQAAEVQIDIGIAPAPLYSATITVGAEPSQLRFVSGVPLAAAVTARETAEGAIELTVQLEAVSTEVVKQGLNRKQRQRVAAAVPEVGVLANPTILFKPGQQAEFFAGGQVSTQGGEHPDHGVQLRASATP